MNRRIVLCIIAVVAAIDQLVKILLVATLTPAHAYEIIPGFFRFYLIRNSGAAFSMGTGATWIFTLIQLAAVVLVLYFAPKMRDKWTLVGFALIGGGALGNLLDRLFRAPGFGVGHVVDFISVGNFAIFNLADSAITIGVVLYCIGALMDRRSHA